MDKLDIDQLATLVLEVIPDSSCLIFCPTKKNCQNIALLLTKLLPRYVFDHITYCIRLCMEIFEGLMFRGRQVCTV